MKILRYNDPETGAREIPVFNEPQKGKTVIGQDSVFSIDTSSNSVTVVDGGKTFALGRQICYMVD